MEYFDPDIIASVFAQSMLPAVFPAFAFSCVSVRSWHCCYVTCWFLLLYHPILCLVAFFALEHICNIFTSSCVSVSQTNSLLRRRVSFGYILPRHMVRRTKEIPTGSEGFDPHRSTADQGYFHLLPVLHCSRVLFQASSQSILLCCEIYSAYLHLLVVIAPRKARHSYTEAVVARVKRKRG